MNERYIIAENYMDAEETLTEFGRNAGFFSWLEASQHLGVIGTGGVLRIFRVPVAKQVNR
jgi:hypothetical protein